MTQQPTPITQTEMDAMVVDALTTWPEAQLDPSIVNDLEKATTIMRLADEFRDLLKPLFERIKVESRKEPGERSMTAFEVGVMIAVPDIYEHLTPRDPIQAGLVATLSVIAIAGRAKADAAEGATPDEISDAMMELIRTDLPDCVMAVLDLDKAEQLDIGIGILTRAAAARARLQHPPQTPTPETPE